MTANGVHTAEITINRFSPRELAQLVINEWGPILTRGRLRSTLLDQWRNLEQEAHYPSIDEQIDIEVYQQLYDRDAIAARVVEIWPRESWQVQPRVYEDEAPDVETPFEAAWKELNFSLQGQQSWRREEQGSAIWEYLKRADELSGIGRFGVLLLGFDDGDDLSRPVKGVIEKNSRPVNPSKDGTLPSPSTNKTRYSLTTNVTTKSGKLKGRKLIYLRPFSEYQLTVQEWEGNFTSPRFGQPVLYSIQFSDPRTQTTGVGSNLATRDVHWTRVIHIADTHHTTSSHTSLAVPRMYPVLNNILGLRKLYIGSPEMYWKAAYPGLALSTQQGTGGDVDIDIEATRDMLEKYFNSLDRSLLLKALTPQILSPTVSDPSSQIMVQLQAICIKITVPMRQFMGSEQGVLAADQDSTSWYMRRVPERENSYITPRIIGPTVDRFILVGVLPEPSEYHIWWPDITVQSAAEKAQLASARTGAYATASSSGIFQTVIAEQDWLTKEMGFSDDEAEQIMENVVIAKEEHEAEQMAQQEEALLQQEEMVKRGLAPDPMQQPVPGQKGANPFQRGKQPPPGNDKDKRPSRS